MPEREYNVGGYRYGFNGKEMDNEPNGQGNQYDYGFRIYNPRLGKFLSVDPLTKSYPWYTPYQFAGNKPIVALDLDGLEDVWYFTLTIPDGSVFRKCFSIVDEDYVVWRAQLVQDLGLNEKDIPEHGILRTEVKQAKYGGPLSIVSTSYSPPAVISASNSAMDVAMDFINSVGEKMDDLSADMKGDPGNNPTTNPFSSVEMGVRVKGRVGVADVVAEAKMKGETETDVQPSAGVKISNNPTYSVKDNSIKMKGTEGNAFIKFNVNDNTPQFIEGSFKVQAFVYVQANFGVSGFNSFEVGLTTSNPDISFSPMKVSGIEVSTDGCKTMGDAIENTKK